MPNIAEVINKTSSTQALYLALEANNKPRFRLGLSQIGHKCPRFLWYCHNKYPQKQPEGRVLSLFQIGNLVEDQLIMDFAKAGIIIRDQQKSVSFTYNDITLKGFCDGIVTGLLESDQEHLWECKTVNKKGFAKFLKYGYEAYSGVYKAQVHAYMLGLKLKNAFVTVYCKDDSQLYQERIKLKKEWIIEKLQDVFAAISGDIPERVCPRPDFWEAKW